MHPDINQAILQLLTDEGQLCLSSLGTFRLQPQAATVSTIEGRSRPPAKLVTFNNNLKLDDGRLLRHLIEIEGMDESHAQHAIDAFSEKLLREIHAGRMVTLDGIGRLFKDHTGEIRFNTGDHNLDKAAYGLPDVAITPIIRTERAPVNTSGPAPVFESTIPTPVSLEELQAEPEPLTVVWGWIRENIWAIAIATAVIFASGMYLLNRSNGTPEANKMERTAPPPPNDRVDVPPSENATLTRPEVPESTSSPTLEQTTTEEEVPEETATAEGHAIIGLYRLGNQANVDRNVQRIREAGYEPFTRTSKKLTRVGIQLNFKSDRELNQQLTTIRRKFTQDAFILEKNGQRYRQ